MMPASEPQELVQLLHRIEQRSRAQAIGLPQQEEVQQYLEGVIFSLNEYRLVAPMSEVAELLQFPADVTQVPGTQPWVRGVANIRGTLLPIIDLQLFLGGEPVPSGRRSRVLIIKHKEIYTGLLVKEVLGMRHFPERSHISYPPPEGLLGKFIDTAFEHEGDTWPVFGMFALAESSEFQTASL
ncbi:hypothetical protein MNBD_GAMMA26-224 [hydrothermal vent metagenome]|uniref:CheW-like domain-containing protein n=1 Tax=hydrothermal vent metagenome TaxID=652676 RepID=A0A3B1AKJ7_9ZZZZ